MVGVVLYILHFWLFPLFHPDMAFMVDWVLEIKYVSVFNSLKSSFFCPESSVEIVMKYIRSCKLFMTVSPIALYALI